MRDQIHYVIGLLVASLDLRITEQLLIKNLENLKLTIARQSRRSLYGPLFDSFQRTVRYTDRSLIDLPYNK